MLISSRRYAGPAMCCTTVFDLRSIGIPYSPRDSPTSSRNDGGVRRSSMPSPPATAPLAFVGGGSGGINGGSGRPYTSGGIYTPYRELYPESLDARKGVAAAAAALDAALGRTSSRAHRQHSDQKEAALVTVPDAHLSPRKSQAHSSDLARKLRQLSAQIDGRAVGSDGGSSSAASVAAHHRSVQGSLDALRSLGRLLGAEGEVVGQKLSRFFSHAIYTDAASVDAPTAFSSSTPQQTHLQLVAALEQRVTTAEQTVHSLLARGSHHHSSSTPSSPRSPRTPDARVSHSHARASSPPSNVGPPMISLERFYRQLDLMAQNMLSTDALQQTVNELKQDLYRADVQAVGDGIGT